MKNWKRLLAVGIGLAAGATVGAGSALAAPADELRGSTAVHAQQPRVSAGQTILGQGGATGSALTPGSAVCCKLPSGDDIVDAGKKAGGDISDAGKKAGRDVSDAAKKAVKDMNTGEDPSPLIGIASTIAKAAADAAAASSCDANENGYSSEDCGNEYPDEDCAGYWVMDPEDCEESKMP